MVINSKIITLLTGIFIFSPLLVCKISAKNSPDNESKSKIVLSGDVQYRFRYAYESAKDSLGNDMPAVGDYTNRYGWNFRVKAHVSGNVLLGMRLSNPKGYASDNIKGNVDKVSKEPQRLLSIPEMYFKWHVGPLSLAGGIIPVPGNTVLGLAAFEDKAYKNAVTAWKNYTNLSQTGLDLGLAFISNETVSFSLEFLFVTARDNVDSTEITPSDALKNDQFRFLLSLPTSFLEEKLSFTPRLHMRTNMSRSKDEEKATHSLIGGINVMIKPIRQFSITLGFAGGGYSNDCMKHDVGYDTLKTAPLGLLSSIKLKMKPGYGKGIVIFKISNSKDREADPDFIHTMLRWDVKYEFPIKGLTLMPRLRSQYSFNSSNTDKTKVMELRPELFFMSEF